MTTRLCTSYLLSIVVLISLSAPSPGLRAQNLRAVDPASGSSGYSLTAILKGTVVDEHDAVVPEAEVLVADLDGALKREAKTNRDGSFAFQLFAPRVYTLLVQHQGFRPAEIKEITLKVQDQLALRIQLRVRNIGESITIDNGFDSLRQSPAVGRAVDGSTVQNLPLSSKTLQPIVSLVPSTVLTKSIFTEQGQFSVNGQRANANYFLVDGVSANIGVAAGAGLGQTGAGVLPTLTVLGTTQALFSTDELQEVKIQTSSYAPEFGRTPGGQISVSTRSGSNQFHGSLFEFFRHDALDANDWFANRDGMSNPQLRHHDFGANLGGPLVKNRSFFFASYEGVRLRSPQVATREVPSLAARQNALPQLRSFLNAFPVPNGENTKDGLARFTQGYSDPATVNTTGLRVDYRPGERVSLFARYSYAPSFIAQRGVGSSLNTSLLTHFKTQSLTAGATLEFSSGTQNETRINYSRMDATKSFDLDNLGGAVIPSDSILFPPSISRGDSMYGFSLGNGSSFFMGRDVDNVQRQINLVDNVSIVTGAHNLRFGIDYRRLLPVYGQRKYNQLASFNGVPGALAGIASSVSIVTQDKVSLSFSNFSAYAQDTWRVNPRLSLTYGLRWEVNPAPSGQDGHGLFTAVNVDDPANLSPAPLGRPHYKTSYLNFAPRAGLTYQLFQTPGKETLLRMGAGIFYDVGAGMVANSASYFPYLRRKSLTNVPYPLDAASAEPRPFTLNAPFSTVRVFEPDFKLPLTFQWNVAVEQSLGTSQTLTASYVGALGRRLLRSEGFVQPDRDFQQVFVVTNDATSDYHSLQLQFQRRLAKRLQALAAYTWSHSIDINSNDSFTNIPSSKIDPSRDRGPSDFDVRHSFATAITYDMPAVPLRGPANELLRNWSLDAMVIARTATPVDVFSSRNIGFGLFNFRPDRIEGIPLYLTDPSFPGGRIINRAAFAIPAAQRQGTLGRNSLRGFPVSQVNFSLRRAFKLDERFNLQLRAEFINLLNHPNFGDPVGDLGSGLFGYSTSMFGRSLGSGGANGGLSPLYQLGGPRSIQLGIKLQF
jgi:Carboxypeptidase regulatory-like domain/TonB dependent receptor-like, beta-barrel